MMENVIVRIVDDDPAVIDGLTFLLESEGWQVRAYTSATDFLAADSPSTPGCLILDVRMPEMTGLELQEVLRERGYAIPIIFLTGHGDIDMAVSTIRKGAVEFLQKGVSNERLIATVADAIRRSLSGFASISIDPFEASRRWQELTERQMEILRYVAAGRLNREIAARLCISVRTVETVRATALKKLGIRTVAELNTLISIIQAQ